MSHCLRRSVCAIAVALLLPLVFGGCKKKPNLHSCRSDHDCRAEIGGPGGVCVMGNCHECAEHSDCPDLKQCINNRCTSHCQADADCAQGHHCENNGCMEDCLSDASCFGDKVCAKGRCVAQGLVNDAYASGQCSALPTVHFGFDRYDINREDHHHLDRVAQCLETNPSATLTIGGHTDNRGTPGYNMVLSLKRTKEAENYLRSKGIASARINTVPFGEQRPISTEDTEDGWQQNRRAEFSLETP